MTIHTLVKDIARRTIIHNHDLAEIGFHTSYIFNIVAAAESAVLTIVASAEVFSILFEPVDYRIGVLLHRRREDDQIVPLAHLFSPISHKCIESLSFIPVTNLA